MIIPLNYKKLRAALDQAVEESGTEDMSVFIWVRDSHRPHSGNTFQVAEVETARYADPGEVNYSVYLITTPPG